MRKNNMEMEEDARNKVPNANVKRQGIYKSG
jgi:hypothetical protein